MCGIGCFVLWLVCLCGWCALKLLCWSSGVLFVFFYGIVCCCVVSLFVCVSAFGYCVVVCSSCAVIC